MTKLDFAGREPWYWVHRASRIGNSSLNQIDQRLKVGEAPATASSGRQADYSNQPPCAPMMVLTKHIWIHA